MRYAVSSYPKCLPCLRLPYLPFQVILAVVMLGAGAQAQRCVLEQEPNQTPVEATAFSALGCLWGELTQGDQDIWRWELPEQARERYITFELTGPPEKLTQVVIMRFTFTPDGKEVMGRKDLLKLKSLGERWVSEPLLLKAGEYYLGISNSGGEGEYLLEITSGASLPSSYNDLEPNDTPEEARTNAGAFALSGTLQESPDWHAWELSEEDAAQLWQLRMAVSLGGVLTAQLHDDSGNTIISRDFDSAATLTMPDLALDPGRYFWHLGPASSGASYILALRPQGIRSDGAEIEPNDYEDSATFFDVQAGISGMLRQNDRDYLRFRVDTPGTYQFDFGLSQEGVGVTLYDEKGEEMIRRGLDKLGVLTLSSQSYLLRLESASEDVAYQLTMREASPTEEGFEYEPNDHKDYANPLPDTLAIRGSFTGRDFDAFYLDVKEPTLYRLQLLASGLHDVEIYDEGGAYIKKANGGERRVRIDNLTLFSGRHTILVDGEDGEYALRVLPLGPAPLETPVEATEEPARGEAEVADAPEASDTASDQTEEDITVMRPRPAGILEREPNDDYTRAQRLRWHEPYVGLLSGTWETDTDMYRFSLFNDQYVRLTVTSPADAKIAFDVSHAGRTEALQTGEAVVFERWLYAGDYAVELWAREPSDDYYQIVLERLDPLIKPQDAEPNDTLAQASALSLRADDTLSIEGTIGQHNDYDWFLLPVISQPQTFIYDVTQGNVRGNMYQAEDGDFVDLITYNRDLERNEITLPADTALALRLSGDGSYHVTLTPVDKSTDTDHMVDEGLPATLEVTLSHTTVAAYWPQGQRVPGELTITNQSSNPLDLTLYSASSHHQVYVGLPEHVTVSPKRTKRVPFEVVIDPDLRDDQPITLHIGAAETAEDQKPVGAKVQLSVAAELSSTCEVPAVQPMDAWPWPDALLGQVNAAWSGLGAEALSDYQRDAQLLDGQLSLNHGPAYESEGVVTIDLAGDEPVTLSALILNPLSRGDVSEQLWHFELLTSLDGETYNPALSGALQTHRTGQLFPFKEPRQATHVRLRVIDNHQGHGYIHLGEMMLLTPDLTTITDHEAVVLSHPNVGGHIVRYGPRMHDIITSDIKPGYVTYYKDPPNEVSWVLGFHHNRAAQLSALQVTQYEELRHQNAAMMGRLMVSVSLESPVGPWEPVALWEFSADAGEVSQLMLPEMPWARFIKFSLPDIPVPEDEYVGFQYPALIEVIERPVSDGYRSAIGVWDAPSARGPYEFLALSNTSHISADSSAALDANDTQAQAESLTLGEPLHGFVTLGHDEDWLSIDVPERDNVLLLTLKGSPSIQYQYELFDSEGNPVALEKTDQKTSTTLTLKAYVDPGRYDLHLTEPPRSVVFVWDNSGSMGAYTHITYNALAQFAQRVQPDRETVGLAVFNTDGPYFITPRFISDPQTLLSALAKYDRRHGSSDAEPSLLGVSEALGTRIGTRAVLLITDAESSGYRYTTAMWRSLEKNRPRVFTFEISSAGNDYAQDLMQDWGSVGGLYQSIGSTGELEVGFSRVSCMLRRPKAYQVMAKSAAKVLGDGQLKVVAQPPEEGEDSTSSAAQPQNAVEVILDASGSMWRKLEGRYRYVIAKEVLQTLVHDTLPPEVPFALRVFGNREASSCRSDLEIPLKPLQVGAVSSVIASIEPQPYSGTPIAASLAQVSSDLASAEGHKTVVLITDGEESCDGDVEAAVEALRAQQVDVVLNIIGFDLDAEDKQAARAQFQRWAELGGGTYYDAASAEALTLSLTQAAVAPVLVPFEVLDHQGNLVATGEVGGDALVLPAGSYEVLIADEAQRLPVVVRPEATFTVTVP